MSNMVELTLYGGPMDGDTITIARDNLKIKPIVDVETPDGTIVSYALDDDGKFVWLQDPNDPKFQRGMFVCDDDGNVISEEHSIEDVLNKLQELDREDE